MMGDTTDWTRLREFESVLLTESFVLSWSFESDSLLVDLDLCLAQSHPFFEKPRPAQKACIRPASLDFPFCTRATADAPSRNAASVPEAIENFGLGAILGFQRTGEGRYELTGKFGVVEIHSERPILRLKSASS